MFFSNTSILAQVTSELQLFLNVNVLCLSIEIIELHITILYYIEFDSEKGWSCLNSVKRKKF